MANLSNPWSHRRRCFKHLHWQVLLQYLNGSRVKFRMSFCNEGLMPFSVMIVWPNYGDLGYDLGYLRHGSFGSGYARWPGRSGARPRLSVWRGLPVVLWPRAVRPSRAC